MAISANPNQYVSFVQEVKTLIRSRQAKAAVQVNAAALALNWELGALIAQRQSENQWGDAIVDQLARDLKSDLPDVKGFSRANLYQIKRFYQFYGSEKVLQLVRQFPLHDDSNEKVLQAVRQVEASSADTQKVQQLVGQLTPELKWLLSRLFLVPWGHHIHILTKSNSEAEALFYVNQVIANHWSREQLLVQMEQNLFARQGKAITNFAATLPPNEAAHAQLLLKDPYNFGFLQLDAQASELHIEVKLTEQITRFLLELGKGFAFLGRQVPLNVGSKEYRLDLLFYHVKLRCYVVIELKAGPFEPEFAGKMNFYLSAVDDQFRHPADNPSIGILLCRGKDRLEVEYALRDIQKPIGVSDFLLTPDLPVNLEDALPTVEDFENRIHLTD